VTVLGSGAEDGHVADKRGRSQSYLIDDIKEQWAYERGQQEELQKVLAKGLDKHETTNWLKKAGWRAYFKEKDLAEIYAYSCMLG
jgi:hypothetical protein